MSEVNPKIEKSNTSQLLKEQHRISSGNNSPPQKTGMEYFHFYLTIFLKILAVMLAIMLLSLLPFVQAILASFFVSDEGKKPNEFEFHLASEFANTEYYGRSDLFRTIIHDMMKIIDLTETKDKSELANSFNVTVRNYLLYGPPGTGKTLFVKKLIYLLDSNLKKKYKIDSEKKEDNLVRAYFISPSMLEDKFLGETERKISTLFKEARNSKGFKATFIFIDEIDSFFGERTSTGQDHYTKQKTEFLNLLSGINEDIKSNCFLLGATNLKDNIDDAFLRRMGHQIKFSYPKLDEIKDILIAISKDWAPEDHSAGIIDNISEIFYQRIATHSLITDVCRKMLFTFPKTTPGLLTILKDAVIKAEAICQRIDEGQRLGDLRRNDGFTGTQYTYKCAFTLSYFVFNNESADEEIITNE